MAMIAAGYRQQSDLAKISGVSQPTINRILKGKGKYPDAMTLYKLAKICKVSVEWLVTGETSEIGTSIVLTYITGREAYLLTLYRKSDDLGQSTIISNAEVVTQFSSDSSA